MCKWARWRIDEMREHKIAAEKKSGKKYVEVNWMKRARERLAQARGKKTRTNKPRNEHDEPKEISKKYRFRSISLNFSRSSFYGFVLYLHCSFHNRTKPNQNERRRKTTISLSNRKFLFIFVFECSLCFAFHFNFRPLSMYIWARIWVQVRALFCLFIWLAWLFGHSIASSPKIWSVDLNASKYYGFVRIV